MHKYMSCHVCLFVLAFQYAYLLIATATFHDILIFFVVHYVLLQGILFCISSFILRGISYYFFQIYKFHNLFIYYYISM